MYSVLSALFVIGVFLIVAGFLGRAGTDGISDTGENDAAALRLLVTYVFLILSMVSLFTGIVVAIASLLLLNYGVKETSVHQWIVSAIGSIVALLPVGTIPILIVSLFKKSSTARIGLIGTLFLFSKC